MQKKRFFRVGLVSVVALAILVALGLTVWSAKLDNATRAGGARDAALSHGASKAGHGGQRAGNPSVTGTGSKLSNAGPAPKSFPSSADTGYLHAPGYPGHLHKCSVQLRADTTYKYCEFPGGLAIRQPNITLLGCLFQSNSVLDANVDVDANHVTFAYDTFEPARVSVPPVRFGLGYQYGINQNGPYRITINASNIWGFGEAVQMRDPDGSSKARPLLIENSYIHSPSAPGPQMQYHVDGILSSVGGPSYVTIRHNTIMANADTNAIALQTAGGGSNGTPYNHITVTGNYFSGFGYMINTGGNTRSTHMAFTDNVWGTNFKPWWGPLYGGQMYTDSSLGGRWAGNTIHVVPGTTWMSKRNDGLFWWPTDGNPSNGRQVVGHKKDFRGGA